MHYNYFRDYEPAIGRYVQSDPIGLKGGINTFSYVSAAPLIAWDEFGLACQTTILVKEPWELADERNTMSDSHWRVPKYQFEVKRGTVCYRYIGDTVFVLEVYRNVQFWQRNRYTNECTNCMQCGEMGPLTCGGWMLDGPIDAKEVFSGPWFRTRSSFEERINAPCVRINRRPPGPSR
ncbi:MAG: hypothetical protein IPJ28_01850 [Betaproteobacteria bacterium]|nr:hypothetical protein [Betaproteobacteria bacterium]